MIKVATCDCFGVCPYNANYSTDCSFWCGAEEPQDYPEAWECGVDDDNESEYFVCVLGKLPDIGIESF